MADNPQTPEEMREFINAYMRSLREQDDVYLSLKRTTAKLNAAFEDLKKAEDENTNALDKSSDAYKKEMAARTQLDQSIKRSVNTYIQDQQRIKKAKKDETYSLDVIKFDLLTSFNFLKEKKYLNECIDTGWISSEGPFIKKFEETEFKNDKIKSEKKVKKSKSNIESFIE
mgnify:CR=1 FL=1